MPLSVSQPQNIRTIDGNGLAVYKDSLTNKFMVKDVYGQVDELSFNELDLDRLVLNPEGSITAPVPDTAILLISKESTDNSIQINVNRKVSLSGDGGAGTLNYMEVSEIESSAVFTGSSARIVHEQATAEFKGEGSITSLYTVDGNIKLDGSKNKNVTLAYGHISRLYLNGTGNDVIDFGINYFAGLNGDNGNATIDDYYAFSSSDNTSGTIEITDSYTSFASFGIRNADMVISNYIGYYHTSAQVTPATNNYFMLNEVDMPLVTLGSIISKDYSIKALNTAPSSLTDTGTLGEIRYTNDALYLCVATDTWKYANLISYRELRIDLQLTATNGGSSSIGDEINTIELSWSGASGTYTLNLPSAVAFPNRIIQVVGDGTLNASDKVELTATGGETIDGGASYSFNKAYNGVTAWSDGTQWIVIQAKAT